MAKGMSWGRHSAPPSAGLTRAQMPPCHGEESLLHSREETRPVWTIRGGYVMDIQTTALKTFHIFFISVMVISNYNLNNLKENT